MPRSLIRTVFRPRAFFQIPRNQVNPVNSRSAASTASTSWKKKPKGEKADAKAAYFNPFLQGGKFDNTDPRLRIGRMMLFAQKRIRGLGLNPQDQIRHETIHRAWMMLRRKRTFKKIRRLRMLEESVRGTMKVLRETDERLYSLAVSGARQTEKRFPLVMRIPTETLPRRVWNYNWTSAGIKGIGGVAKPG